jgi:hypothetical protein
MRAGPLSDSSVIDLLNSSFVCVYVNNEDYRGPNGSASADERKELARIREEALEKKLSVGTVHAYVLTPDGHAVDSLHVADAAKPGKTLSMLERAAERFQPKPGAPVIPPTAQSSAPPASADSVVLHLVSRVWGRGSWGEIPAENWIVLRPEQWSKLLPAPPIEPGHSWELDRDVSARILTYFYPQTENNDADVARIQNLSLRGKVLTIENGSVTARIDGFVEMQHVFYPGHNDPQPLRADVVGVLIWQPAGPPSLKLVTVTAAYAGQPFDVAVESTSHPVP